MESRCDDASTTDYAKKLARRLREDLATAGIEIPHSLALELIAHGSEGFAARLTADRTLVWVIFFAESNPFEGIELSRSNVATFTSTSDICIAVDIDDPRHPVAARPD